MDVLPITCDSCHKDMGILIFPDDVHGNTVKIILEALAIATQCPLCNFTKHQKKRDEEDKQEQQRQLESKYDAIERHERADSSGDADEARK